MLIEVDSEIRLMVEAKLLLSGMSHGLLVNLRPERVAHELVSTTLDHAERRRFTILGGAGG